MEPENNNFTLLEGLRPLRRYFSLSTSRNAEYTDIESSEGQQSISDWGIDAYDTNSSPTLINDLSFSTENESFHGLTPNVENFNDAKFSDWGFSHKAKSPLYCVMGKNCNLQSIFVELILKNKQTESILRRFVDEFRYSLITSRLLDDTILISTLLSNRDTSQLKLNRAHKSFSAYFGRIVQLANSFTIHSAPNESNIIIIVLLVVFLRRSRKQFSYQTLKMVAVVLMLSLFLIFSSQSVQFQILRQKLMNQMRAFVEKFQKIEIRLQKLIQKYKEVTLFSNVTLNSTKHKPNPSPLYDMIMSVLVLEVNGLEKSIKLLLPFAQGAELENYCGIYNVDIGELSLIMEELKPLNLESFGPLDNIKLKFKKFQLIRKLFLCLLLALNHEHSGYSSFKIQVLSIFHCEEKSDLIRSKKWILISSELEKLNAINTNLLQSMFEFFQGYENELDTTTKRATSLYQGSVQSSSSTYFMSNEVKKLHSQLLLFNSSLPLNSQLKELDNIGLILEALKLSYEREQSNIKRQIQKANQKIDPVSMDRKKRFSLPSIEHLNNLKLAQRSISSSQIAVYRSKSKVLSTGFSIPLLTVTEDQDVSSRKSVFYDDTYPNMTPSFETLERNEVNDYISENNLLSNDDSVIITSEVNDDNSVDDSEIVKDPNVLKKKLEMKFSKLIATQHEGDLVKEPQPNNEIADTINLNNLKADHGQSVSLMNELRAAISSTS